MKSIIEQASSIMKAIEKAWNQAEQPKEFSIKIFEKEERNFFGMTTKPAKIGIFFGDKAAGHEKQPQKNRPEIKECRPEPRKENKPKQQTHPTPHKQHDNKQESHAAQKQHPAKPAKEKVVHQEKHTQLTQHKAVKEKKIHSAANHDQPEKPKRAPAEWNDTMVNTVRSWLNRTLSLMNMGAVSFNTEITGKVLKVTLSGPIASDASQEKHLFRSFAHLIMSSLRNQFKQEIRDLKITLIRAE